MMDTDEEVTNGRVTLLNGNGPPYFHGYLYMKGEYTAYAVSNFEVQPLFNHDFKLYLNDLLSWADDPLEEALVCAER